MPTVVTRLYEDEQQAARVIDALRAEGFGRLDFDVIAPMPGAPAMVAERIANSGVLADAAPVYAERVAAGNTLIVVHAPFGSAATASAVMDAYGPVHAGVRRQDVFKRARRYRPLPLSGVHFFSGPMMPGVVNWRSPLSSLFFLPTIISSRSKTKLITNRTTPFHTIFRIPSVVGSGRSKTKLITDRTTPLSSMLGLPTVVQHRSNTHVS